MLGVQTEVGMLPHHVSGVDVVVLVPGNGVSVGRQSQLKKKDGKKKENTQWDKPATLRLRGWQQISSD